MDQSEKSESPVDVAAFRSELRASPKLMTYLKALRVLESESIPARRVRLLSSFTVRALEPYLKVEALLSGWRMEPQFEEYSQWQQALLSAPQEGAEADAYVLLLHPEAFVDATRDRDEALNAAERNLTALVSNFRKRCGAPLLLVLPKTAVHAERFGFGLLARGPSEVAATRLCDALRAVAESTAGVYCVDPPEEMVSDRDLVGLYRTMTPVRPAHAPGYAETIARSLSGFFRPRKKVLVCDLDNTLWGGVVGETGADGVAIGPEWPGQAYRLLQRAILDLSESGILLAIASKNNEADAREVFDTRSEMVLRWEDFVARRVDWNDKAENIRSMAEELSLGLDSFVFLDDNPVECARVRTALPQVEVVMMPQEPERFVEELLNCRGFDALSIMAEDKLRTQTYRAEGQRRALQEDAASIDDFLKTLALQADLKTVQASTVERTHQLFNKTNQFHMTLERPTLSEIEARREGLYTISLRDRFGDYGIIGILELSSSPDAMRIDNLIMSCRALGRGMEETALAFAAEQARERNLAKLEIAFVEGPRNQPARRFLEKAEFEAARDEGDGRCIYVRPIDRNIPEYPAAVELNLVVEAA
ncbi:MAG: HAD-IIIC family phosphatase [Alphaproteobacteria bacterium]|nr:HAD-IIIC family phosphatase [Alphaproteobacteria bacterium]